MARQRKYNANLKAMAVAITGTDTYVATTLGPGFQLTAGAIVVGKVPNASTGTGTLNVNGTGAKTLKIKGNNVAANDLDANGLYLFFYDGTNWLILSGALA